MDVVGVVAVAVLVAVVVVVAGVVVVVVVIAAVVADSVVCARIVVVVATIVDVPIVDVAALVSFVDTTGAAVDGGAAAVLAFDDGAVVVSVDAPAVVGALVPFAPDPLSPSSPPVPVRVV